jgi:hypothetical protein
LSNPVPSFLTAAEAFAEGVATQVKTVVTNTKTAALVIFLCGLVTGCTFF